MAVRFVDRPVAMVERALHLRAQVLPERAALRHVDHLRAAADAEHRLALRHEGAQERDLVVVAHTVAIPLGPQRFLAVRLGAHVGAPHQHKAVELLGVSVDRRLAARAPRAALGGGDHEGQDVALHEPVRDVLLDVLQRHSLEDRRAPDPRGKSTRRCRSSASLVGRGTHSGKPIRQVPRAQRRTVPRSPRGSRGGDWSGGRCR